MVVTRSSAASQKSSVTGKDPPVRLAVLGADGFIGSHLVLLATRRAIGVRAICVNDPWRLGGVQGVERRFVPGGRWWDPSFEAELSRCLLGVEALAFLAYTPPPNRELAAWNRHEIDINLQGVHWIAQLAADLGVRVVFASTSNIYGTWHDDPIDEDAKPLPATPYAVAKAAGEEEVRLACARAGGYSLRLATVFGPGEDGPRAVPSFIREYLRGGKPVVHRDGSDVHDYVHVRDVARAFLAACLESPPGNGSAINIGSGAGRSTLDVLNVVAWALDRPVSFRTTHTERKASRLVLRCDRAQRILGVVTREPFETGIAEEADWLKRRYASPRSSAG